MQEDFLGALNDYSRAIQLDSNHVKALINRGSAFESIGKLNEAIDDFSNAIKIDSLNHFAYFRTL
jgi:tetratricopeptide (TPR) repeat protein